MSQVTSTPPWSSPRFWDEATVAVRLTVLVALARLTRSAPACGDAQALGVAGTKAQLVILGRAGSVRIGEPVFANLILPEGFTTTHGQTEPRQLYISAIYRRARGRLAGSLGRLVLLRNSPTCTGRDGPRTCGVVGYLPGTEIPQPQINFTLNDWDRV